MLFFSESMAMVIQFLSFSHLCVLLFLLTCILSHSWISGIKPKWPWQMISFTYVCILLASILLSMFGSVHQGYWPVFFFLLCWHLVWVVEWPWLYRKHWDSWFWSFLQNSLRRTGCRSSLRVWQNSAVNPLVLANFGVFSWKTLFLLQSHH